MNFSEKLKKAAKELNLTQVQMAGMTGKSKASISQYLAGKQMMGINHQTVRKGLQQGVFPWGYGIKTSDHWVYFINAKRFSEIEGINVEGVTANESIG